ncbi:iron chelate uptake ABC transporter family permease subunit [Methylobacterium frigidaeris]|uniref:Petrobactin import system permease protein YclO n=1 Tax=Methylobacterium frigidaeris TaxID=2038277 RepID=A0AA37H675_9HYPH|nr:iron chelate uptake ABC transporter family permease subunit [Methylobacterium frigidaeris]PIK73096.1 enterobactin ABC transporter permease [Methylobacterium frigidaeris]GJD59908.1 Petrobactin import system permease protein YclO [Methylobacterium frigidaeris]
MHSALARARLSPGQVLMLLALAALGVAIAFMTVGANGRWGFVLPFRGTKLASMLLVACAVATATVLFQTVSGNRILTPAIMGFDELYRLIQTGLVVGIGTGGFGDPRLRFLAETGAMVLFALLLYRWLLARGERSLHLLLLVGVICGVLFRSLSQFLQRMLDPSQFVVLQTSFFANFNTVHPELLALAALGLVGAGIGAWRLSSQLDVLLLGRDEAIALGIDHRRTLTRVLVLVALLVSISTALVGPVTFLGLLVANLAYRAMPTYRHTFVLPAAALIAAITLVGGQLVLERVFALNAALSIVIEFLGGLTLLILLARRAR